MYEFVYNCMHMYFAYIYTYVHITYSFKKLPYHVILGKEIRVPNFLTTEPRIAEDRFVWQKMKRRIIQYRSSQVFDASTGQKDPERKHPEDRSTLELLSFSDMRAILVQRDSRIPEFNLFRFAYKWCESQRVHLLKQRPSLINFGSIGVEHSRLVEIEPALKTSDITEALSRQQQKQNSCSEETRIFIEKLAVLKPVTAKSVLLDTGNMFRMFVSSLTDDRHKLDELDDCIAAMVVYLRQHNTSEFDLFQIVCKFGSLRHEYVLSEFVKEIDFVRLTPLQRKLALIDLEPLEKRQVLRVENALYQSHILSAADVGVLEGMFEEQVHRWVMFYADDQCDQSHWKQLNDILQTDVFKMIVFRFLIDAQEWVIAVCVAEKLTLRDTITVNKHSKCRTQVFVSVHDDNNDSCLTALSDDYLLALDGHRLQIFVEKRSQTFVCLMNLDDAADSVGMSVALKYFSRRSFSKDHNDATIWRQQVGRFEIFLNQPAPMVAPAIIVGHYDEYRLLQNSDSASPPSETFRYCAKAFPRLDEEPMLSISDIEEELQKVQLKYYELKRKIAMEQPVESELQDWMTLLQKASEEVEYGIFMLTCTLCLKKTSHLKTLCNFVKS